MVVEIRPDGFYVNGKYFFPIGFNYWPRDTAVRLWMKYNPDAIEHEFSIMHKMGVNCIRMFIMWEDFNPVINHVNQEFLTKFEHFHETATKYNVKLTPTLFIGHMSGQDWMSPWFYLTEQQATEGIPYQEIALPPRKQFKGKVRDIYRDEEVYRQAFLQLESLLPKYKESTTILAWDLSNENQYMMRPKVPEDGSNYIRRLYTKMKELDPNHPITLGMGKMSEVTGFHSFGPKGINRHLDFYSVHTYWVYYYTTIIRTLDYYISYKPGFDVRFAQLSGIPVQFQEFGISARTLAAYRKPTQAKFLGGYYENAIWSGWLNGAKGGILSWDFVDFAPPLKQTEPYNHKPGEMSFGSLDNQYHNKASGEQIQRFARFAQIFDLSQYKLAPNQIGIMLPENYLKYATRNATLKELSDDNPVKKQKKLEATLDCIENQNKSLFTAYLWCRMAHQIPDFLSFDELPSRGLSQYKLLILPNLHQLSPDNTKIINDYLNNGGILYISSNTWIPKGLTLRDADLFKNARTVIKKPSKDTYHLTNVSEHSQNIKENFERIPVLHFYNSLQFIHGIDTKNAIYTDKSGVCPIISINPSVSGKGLFIFHGTSPEINQTSIRRMYKRDFGHILYKCIFGLAQITNDFACSNPFIETGLFFRENSSERMLIVINHLKDPHPFEIIFKDQFTSIRDWEEKSFVYKNNRLSGNLNGYEARCFIIT